MLRGHAGAVAIGEGIELFDITKRQPRLPFDPGTQPRLQRAMGQLERPGRQCGLILNRLHPRFA
jgi:hypothetical protein